MTANQLSIILSNLNEQNVIIKYNNKLLNISGVEFGINQDIGKIFINVEE